MRRVENIAYIDKRNNVVVCAKSFKDNKDNIARRGSQSVKIVQNILRAPITTLAFIFNTIRQIVFVEHLLKITFKRLVEGRINPVVNALTKKINLVLKVLGLISGRAFAVLNVSESFVIVVKKYRRAVGISFDLRRGGDFKSLRICVAESIKRGFDVAARVFVEPSGKFADRTKRSIEFPAVLIALRRRIASHKQLNFWMALHETQQWNFRVCSLNKKLFQLRKPNKIFAKLFGIFFREENNFIKGFEIHCRKFLGAKWSDNSGMRRKIFRRRIVSVKETKLRGQPFVVVKLNINFPNKQFKLFLRDEQRLFDSVVDAVLRERVACCETVAHFNKNFFPHKQTSK